MKNIIVVLSILFLTGCIASTDSVTKPSAQKGGFLGLSQADEIKTSSAGAFKGRDKVVIGAFKVGFVVENKAGQSSGTGLFATRGTAHATATTHLNGVPQSVMQDITNAAYADFVKKLESNGYEVADRTIITNLPEYTKLGKPSPDKGSSIHAQGSDVLYFAPTGQNVIYLQSDGVSTFGLSNANVDLNNVATKAGVPIVTATYIVNFVNSETSGGAHKSYAGVTVGQGISVVPGSGVDIMAGGRGSWASFNGNILLGQPAYSEERFAEITDLTSDTAKAAGYALGVATSVLTGTNRQWRSYSLEADSQKYSQISRSVLARSNDKLVKAMAAHR